MTTPAAPATEPATPATPAVPATPAAPVEPTTPPTATTAPAATTPEETPEQKIERLEAAVKTANAEAAKARTTAKQNAADEARTELAQTIGKALGLVADEPIDPAKLTEQVSAAAKQANLELAVFHAAATAGADASALLDSRTFMAKLADIDPADATAVTTAITEAVQANASFAATAMPRLPAPNPALGSSASGAPDASALIAEAKKNGDWQTVIALENQKLLQPPQR